MTINRNGRIALGLALLCVVVMVVGATFFSSMAAFLPILPYPYGVLYWLPALGALAFVVAALIQRQWSAGIATIVILALTLLPSAGLLFECSRGNCL